MTQSRRWSHIFVLGLAVCVIAVLLGWPEAKPVATVIEDPLDRLFEVPVQALAAGGVLYSTPIGETGVNTAGDLAVVLPYGTDPLYVTRDGVVLVSSNVFEPGEPLRAISGYVAFDRNVAEKYRDDVNSARLIGDLVRLPWQLGSEHVTAETVDGLTVKLQVDAPALGWRWASAPIDVTVTWSDTSYSISFQGQTVTQTAYSAVPDTSPAATPVP